MAQKTKTVVAVATFAFLGYCTKVAIRPAVVPHLPYPAYVNASQVIKNPDHHSTTLNRLSIETPLLPPSTSPSSTGVPTAMDLTKAMFSSWVMIPEVVTLNTIHGTSPLSLDPVVKGNNLAHIFHVDSANEDSVELTWKFFNLTGTHFLRREIRTRENADAGNANAGNAGAEITWRFDTVAWAIDSKESPMASLRGRVLSVFHDLYAKMLLSAAVSKLGY